MSGRVMVIAEPGCTAEGGHNTTLRLIEAAAAAGADCFKAQYVSDPAQLVARRRVPAKYLEPYGWLAYPMEWHAEFRDKANELGMLYGCSTVLPADVAALAPYVDLFKLSSFEALARDMLDAHEDQGGHLIISTGMLEAEQVAWLDRWRQGGNNTRRRVDLLHACSSYPAPLDELNLRVLGQPWCDGLSDHSRKLTAGAIAVSLGARVIETHLRMDDCREDNPDYPVAFTPEEFGMYVAGIREIELQTSADIGVRFVGCEEVLGDGQKRQMPSEAEMARYRIQG